MNSEINLKEDELKEGKYVNKTKLWHIGLFALNNTATNSYLVLMNMVSYLTFGVAGLVMSILLNIATAMRIFDAITDPIIGTLIDRTHKHGKCRPFIIFGQIIMLLSVLTIFTVVTKISNTALAYVAFIGLYAVYIIGYTCQCAITKVGQPILTSDPKQRPMFSLFDSIYNAILFTSYGMILPILASKNGGLSNQATMNTMLLIFIPASIIFSICAIIGIWSKDNDKYFIKNNHPIKFKEFLPVLKHNRGIQMLVISAATDKLATTLAQHTLITTLIFAIILGNYSISTSISIPVTISTIAAILIGTMIARKLGQKKALVWTTIAAIIGMVIFMTIIIVINPSGKSITLASGVGIIFLIGWILSRMGMSVTSGIVIPMIADCSDYETYLTGKSVPGLMGTLFSFIDKLISSIATSILSALFIWAGYGSSIDSTTEYSNKLFVVFIIAYCIIPILGWIATLIAMKFYPLNKEKMKEVNAKLIEIRAEQDEEAQAILAKQHSISEEVKEVTEI